MSDLLALADAELARVKAVNARLYAALEEVTAALADCYIESASVAGDERITRAHAALAEARAFYPLPLTQEETDELVARINANPNLQPLPGRTSHPLPEGGR